MSDNHSNASLNDQSLRARGEARMPALDGLRGWAVLAVMFYHFALPFAQDHSSRASWAILRLMLTGSYGVDMFFVLSGFLITGILLDSKGSDSYFRTFYMRRLVRIFPLYYGVLAVCFGLLYWVPLFHGYAPRQWWLWFYATNFTHIAGFDFDPGFAHFWSLAVEEHFYLVWPIVVLLLSRSTLMLTSMLILTLSPLLRCVIIAGGLLDAETAAMLTPLRLDGLAMGALLAGISRSPGGLVQFRPLAVWLVVAGTFATLCSKALYGSSDGSVWGLSGVGHTTVSVAVSGMLILAITGDGFWSRVLSWNALRFFGKYSYGLYVFHFLLQPWMDGMFWFTPAVPASNILLHIAASTVVTLAVALLSWNLYEKQFLKLKKCFEYSKVIKAERVDENVVTIGDLGKPALVRAI
jgi:peptidoglycan/LPS O-acetylase OafA/YrhL